VGSRALRSYGLDEHGLEWLWPDIDLAHPLGGGSAGVMVRSVDGTAQALGRDGERWRRLFAAPSRSFEALGADIMRPLLHVPRHPLRLARFGLPALAPATRIANGFETDEGRALWGGVAAHAFSPLNRPFSSSVGMALVCAGHAFGWPVAKGGSRAIPDALAGALAAAGGKIETGRRVESLGEVDDAEVVLLDLAPSGVVELAEGRLPKRVERAYRRYRHGPGAFKVDLAVEGGVPWDNEACRRAGTVHAAGSLEEIVRAEADVNAGRMPKRPFVLVGQQYLADPSRSAGDVHPVYAYAHVPNGYTGDVAEEIVAQIERFAPGLRERIVGLATRSAPDIAKYNPNYVGGDIITGANTARQLTMRPRPALDPYSTGIAGVYICSAATPPGAGAHGMCGYNAARSALAKL
jgi:phytoene dehydrogenase-like protein